jgi:hypothetical protein
MTSFQKARDRLDAMMNSRGCRQISNRCDPQRQIFDRLELTRRA